MTAPAVDRTPFDPLLPTRHLDWAFAVVGGLGIAAPVAGVFLQESDWWAMFALPAFVFTTITTFLAGRARSDAWAVLGVFLGCVLPPAALFLFLGAGAALIAAAAGLVAAFALLPFVLVLRGAHANPRDDDGEHVAAFGAAWLLTLSVVMILLASRHGLLAAVVALAAAGLLSLGVLVRDLARAAFLEAVRAGRVPGLVLDDVFAGAPIRVRGTAFSRLRAVATAGVGPFRESELGRNLGAVSVPRGRILAALVLLSAAAGGAVLVLGA